MSPKKIANYLSVLSITGLVLFIICPAAYGDIFDCCCGWRHCPPAYVHYQEGPPKLHFRRICPKPVCNPCCLPHYGYFATCWHPWPFPSDYSHCRYPNGADLQNGSFSPAAPHVNPFVGPKAQKTPGAIMEPAPGSQGIKPSDFRPQLQKY
jgi:hypothetical protein